MLFTGTSYTSSPRSDEIEVSLIGPGYGEALIVHVGDGRWFLIDSCKAAAVDEPASVQYLSDIGIDPAGVFAIIASHWDDDHVRGLSRLLETYPDADFILSRAFGQEEFLTYASAFDSPLTVSARSGVSEIRRALIQANGSRRIADTGAHRCLFGTANHDYSHGVPIEIWSLSPSQFEYDNFLAWVASQMPTIGETRRVAVSRLRNDLSSVLLLKIGDEAVLFGGDLEEEGRAETGWSAVLSSTGRPTSLAGLFKIPHHGSRNGDHPNIWTELLGPEPHLILAPFRHGRTSLPTPDDVARLTAKSPHTFATTSLASRAPRKRDRTVERTIKESTKEFSTVPQIPGLLRLRRSAAPGSSWSVEKFGDATDLANIYK